MNIFIFRKMVTSGCKAMQGVSFRRALKFSTSLLVINSMTQHSTAASAGALDHVDMKMYSSTLEHQEDRYDGVIVDAVRLPNDLDDFVSHLKHSLQAWKLSGKRGVWLKIPSDKMSFAASAIESGFVMHHAENDYLMLTHWLSEDENKLPPNASHQIGVGCIVVNDEGDLLAVQEKNGPLKGTGFWKIPTGLLDAKEDIHVASCREVLEETGIETEFVGLLCFRHAHNFMFGKSDLFFVCLLKPLTKTIVKQESEIESCEWISLEKYMNQKLFLTSPVYSRLNLFIEQIAKEKEKKSYLQRFTLPLGNRPGYNTLYLPIEPPTILDS